jgi:hypothetical protein
MNAASGGFGYYLEWLHKQIGNEVVKPFGRTTVRNDVGRMYQSYKEALSKFLRVSEQKVQRYNVI